METPFEYKIVRVDDELFETHYIGHLGEHDVAVVDEQHKLLAGIAGRVGLYFDVSRMTGFHRSQVKRHGDFLFGHRGRIDGIALVGASATIRFGAVTVGLIARLPLKVFGGRKDALDWLASMKRARPA